MEPNEKELIRQKIWSLLEEKDLVDFPRPCYGRIPNFRGARTAAEKIRNLPEFSEAKCVFCAPDGVLRRVREIVLEEGKILAAALPHIEALIEIEQRGDISKATTISGMRRHGKPLKTEVDLFVQGSVAVDLWGNRLGKGKGYGDTEYWLLKKMKLLDERAKVVTLVHPIQVVPDLRNLMSERDVRIDYIITPDEVLRAKTRPRNSLSKAF